MIKKQGFTLIELLAVIVILAVIALIATPIILNVIEDSKKGAAFTSFESNGLWVGKFETGYKGATSTTSAQVNSNDLSKVIVKPNVYSWRNITINNIFLTSYNYKRNLDSHMMKNTEWGAVAYLSHSKYGINDDIRINNNSAYITGYAKTERPTCGYTNSNENCNRFEGTSINQDGTYTKRYNTEIGYLASTTGNITGIYDVSGGAHEYIAAYMAGKLGSSEITPTDYDSKYFNVYNASSTTTGYQYRNLGDATGEMGPFTTLKSTGGNGDKTAYVSSCTLLTRISLVLLIIGSFVAVITPMVYLLVSLTLVGAQEWLMVSLAFA